MSLLKIDYPLFEEVRGRFELKAKEFFQVCEDDQNNTFNAINGLVKKGFHGMEIAHETNWKKGEIAVGLRIGDTMNCKVFGNWDYLGPIAYMLYLIEYKITI